MRFFRLYLGSNTQLVRLRKFLVSINRTNAVRKYEVMKKMEAPCISMNILTHESQGGLPGWAVPEKVCTFLPSFLSSPFFHIANRSTFEDSHCVQTTCTFPRSYNKWKYFDKRSTWIPHRGIWNSIVFI